MNDPRDISYPNSYEWKCTDDTPHSGNGIYNGEKYYGIRHIRREDEIPDEEEDDSSCESTRE